MIADLLSLGMFLCACGVLLLGFPVAFALAGTALVFACLGHVADVFNLTLLGGLPSRIFGIMVNEVLVAVPMFIFMGVMLERSKVAEQLLHTLGLLFGRRRGGLGFSVIIVGMLLAASTGIVGATVVTMGLLSLPTMLRAGYDPRLASGCICASGTLGQIVPPSIVLVLLGDMLQGANTQAQLTLGNFAPEPVSVVDLFAGAFIPGMLLVGCYLAWQGFIAISKPSRCPSLLETGNQPVRVREALGVVVGPSVLVVAVLGSILAGIATPTESAALGAAGAMVIAAVRRSLTLGVLREAMQATTRISSMVFVILIGASVFSLVFRGLGGDALVSDLLGDLPGGRFSAVLAVMALMFLLGFFLDFIEIIFVVVPIVGPVLLAMDLDPIWLGIMIALNLQTSFLTPPFGFALFYLQGVAPDTVTTLDIYRGIVPFVSIQVAMLSLVAAFPELATWLPQALFGA